MQINNKNHLYVILYSTIADLNWTPADDYAVTKALSFYSQQIEYLCLNAN